MNEEITPRHDAEQIDKLKEKIRELEDKLAAAEAAAEPKKHLNAAVEDRAELLFEEIKPYLEKYRGGGEELLRRAAEKVWENPGASLAIAFGAGLIAAKLFERGKD